jgi:hypothetical protein
MFVNISKCSGRDWRVNELGEMSRSVIAAEIPFRRSGNPRACTFWIRAECPSRIVARDWRDWRDEVGIQICPRRAFLACPALHAPRSVTLEEFFNILLR